MQVMTIEQAWPDVFTPAEAQLLSGLKSASMMLRPRQQITRHEAAQNSVLYLSSGFVGVYRLDRLGRRQFLGLYLPGDYVDLAGFFLGRPDYNMDAFGFAMVEATSCERLQGLGAQAPAILERLWHISMIDAAIDRYWIFRIGRLVGRARIANFLCEMLLRLYARGLCSMDRFEVPLAQIDLAEICGMTPVHASRMLAELRDEGICTFTQGMVQVMKLPELFQTGQYRWDYLHLGSELDREIRERVMSGTAKRRVSA